MLTSYLNLLRNAAISADTECPSVQSLDQYVWRVAVARSSSEGCYTSPAHNTNRSVMTHLPPTLAPLPPPTLYANNNR